MASDDDWETADLAPALATVKPKDKPFLRAGAPSFQPRPAVPPHVPTSTPTPTPTSSALYTGSAGPSRQTSTGGYVARPPISAQGQGFGDEWFRGPKQVTNRQIWDAANNHAASHFPTASAPSASSFAPTGIASPLPQPGITILRRQPGDQAKKKSGGTQTPPKTMEEREEEYRLARERIFGAGTSEATPAPSGSGERSRSGGGRSRTPNTAPPRGSAERDPYVQGYSQDPRIASPSRLYDDGGLGQAGYGGLGGLGPVPVQVQARRSPAPGILRQPMGPGEGGGFGR